MGAGWRPATLRATDALGMVPSAESGPIPSMDTPRIGAHRRHLARKDALHGAIPRMDHGRHTIARTMADARHPAIGLATADNHGESLLLFMALPDGCGAVTARRSQQET